MELFQSDGWQIFSMCVDIALIVLLAVNICQNHQKR